MCFHPRQGERILNGYVRGNSVHNSLTVALLGTKDVAVRDPVLPHFVLPSSPISSVSVSGSQYVDGLAVLLECMNSSSVSVPGNPANYVYDTFVEGSSVVLPASTFVSSPTASQFTTSHRDYSWLVKDVLSLSCVNFLLAVPSQMSTGVVLDV